MSNKKEKLDNDKVTPTVYFMVGLPGSGKSTLVNKILEHYPQLPIISTDLEVEKLAKSYGISYEKAMSNRHGIKNENGKYIDFYEEAYSIFRKNITKVLENKESFIWEQTNTVKQARLSKINRLRGSKYNIVVIYMDISYDEWSKRLSHRNSVEGEKRISDKNKADFYASFTVPDYTEGMTSLYFVQENGNILKIDKKTLEKNSNNVSINHI